MAGTKGNTNRKDGMAFLRALRRALAHKSDTNLDKGLDLVAEQLVEAACKGEPWAVVEVANRFDGKPTQTVNMTVTDKDTRDMTLDELEQRITELSGGVSKPAESPPDSGIVH